MKYIISVPVLALFFLACENPITFVWDVNVETDAAEYTLPATAAVTVRNDSESPVDIRMCNGGVYFMLQRQVGVEWNTVYTAECPDEEMFETLPERQSIQFTVDLSVLDNEEDSAGTYRIEIIVYPGNDRRVKLPENMRISNTFIITETDGGENNS